MKLGFFTANFSEKPLEEVAEMAAGFHIQELPLLVQHYPKVILESLTLPILL